MVRPDASAKLAATRPKDGPSKALIAAVVVAVLIIAAVVAVIVNSENGKANASKPQAALPNGGGVVVSGDALKSGAPTVDLYEDFQCPFCKQLEASAGKQFVSLANSGQIKLVVHPLSFLDGNFGNDASLRAASAALCAADVGKFTEYHTTVFQNQPAKEGTGYTDAQLTQFADQAGITGSAKQTFEKCYKDGKYVQYVKNVQTRADKIPITQTPTVKVNGKDLSTAQLNQVLSDGSTLKSVIEAAAK